MRLAGLEPTTSASAGQRSIQLSYKRIIVADSFTVRYFNYRCRPFECWCRRWDLNPHVLLGHCALNAARLPFRHFGPFLHPRPLLMPSWWAILDSNQ